MLIAAVAIVVGGAVAVVLAFNVLTRSDWGRRQIAGLIQSQMAGYLSPGTKLRIAKLDRAPNGDWVADSISVVDSAGTAVLSVDRLSVDISLTALLRREVRLGFVQVDGARVTLSRGNDGTWNAARLMAPSTSTAQSTSTARSGPGMLVVADSIEVRNTTVELLLPDTTPALPPVRRSISGIHVALGPTTIASPESSGGNTVLNALAMTVSDPKVTLVNVRGSLRWWSDSLQVDLSEIRLPASIAKASGTIGWADTASVNVTLDAQADTVSVGDIAWLSPRIPREGWGAARVAVRTMPGGALRYAVSDMQFVANGSRVGGSATVTAGARIEIRDVALTADLPDLALLREVAGDSAIGSEWRGALTARVRGRGGFLDSLLIDSVSATFADARIGGMRSRVGASGAVDASGSVPRLMDVRFRVDTLALQSLGAIATGADSLHGMLTGAVTLNGPTTAIAFSALAVEHVDGDFARTKVSGAGRVSSDRAGGWLDADLSVDAIAIATLVRGRTTQPLQSTPSGTVQLRATGDTVDITVALSDASAELRIGGTMLLDSARTRLDIDGTLSSLNPGAFLARRDIPSTSLSGQFSILIDEPSGQTDRHIALVLDSTSTVGDSRILGGEVRFGFDGDGFHVDTADVRADGWTVNASGRIASDSTRSDTLNFAVAFDSLGALSSILLDSTGAPRFPDLDGSLRTETGTVIGSFKSAALSTTVQGATVRYGDTSIGQTSVTIDLRNLPDLATGTVSGWASTVASGSASLDTASFTAEIAEGERARVALDVGTADSTSVTASASVTWAGSGYLAVVDSLSALVRGHPWRMNTAATIRIESNSVSVDSIVMTSDHGAFVAASGSVPERDSVNARVRVNRLGFEEISFLDLFPPELSGQISADATVTGTRDAPVISLTAALDSIRSEDRTRPSVTLEARYADRSADVQIGATIDGRRVLDARGAVPLDLTLRDIAERIPDAPITMRLVTDSLTLAYFEGLAPRIRGLAGNLQGTVDIGGTLRNPRGRGTLTLVRGAFEVPRVGFAARNAAAEIELAGDSIIIKRLRMADGGERHDTASLAGVVRLAGTNWSDWVVDLHSVANNFRVIDDPRLATAEADWILDVEGTLAEPRVSGSVQLPYAVFTIGQRRRQRNLPPADDAAPRMGVPSVNGVVVTLGSDVRLKSREANVQLTGGVELFGPLNHPWISGSVTAERGTYRVDLNVIRRTFLVDSGVVILEGTPDIAPALDIYASYLVKRPEESDVHIRAHVFGTTDRPRLDLSSDLGTASGQSEIISYLVFGQPSFKAPTSTNAAAQTATAAIVPSIGGFLEGILGTVLPFFSTLQVTSVASGEAQSIASSPVNGLLNNNYAITGGRQVGTDTFFSVTAGRCGSGRLGASSSSPIWFGAAAEYLPKQTVGAAISIDPGPAPCNRVSGAGDTYQFGFDLSYDWKFRGKP
ncbi:MAG: translocation/assembly module TamB domain-containing protein [Gemmatimonadetes bacterium]|nr:translocation/assembly module TamB domain-containing protein [Gemmatimonadota bacterium]